MEIPDHLIGPIDRFINGEATIQDEKAITEWYYAGHASEVVIEVPDGYDEKADFDRMKRRLYAAKQEIDAREKMEGRPAITQQMMGKKWLQVAAILLVVAGGIFLINSQKGRNHHDTNGQGITAIAGIEPGSKRATLTLSDGRSFNLDSTRQGKIARDGTTDISLGGTGQLQYAPGIADPASDVGVQAHFNTITIPRGGEFTIELPDGTKVWINAASTLRFPSLFTGKSREVELVSGEAYFQVAKDASMPFHIKVNNADIEVLGTSFNINAYPESTSVITTLLSGRVKAGFPGATSRLLSPGQQARQDATGAIFLKNGVDTLSVVAWKRGYFQFDESSLQDVMNQLSRWYDMEVEYENGVVPKKAIVGRYSRASTFAEAMNMLTLVGVRYTIHGRKILIQR